VSLDQNLIFNASSKLSLTHALTHHSSFITHTQLTGKHLERVMSFVEVGKKEGATLACGGELVGDSVGEGFENGMYMSPAIFTNCHDDMTIVRTEIFGPVACVLSFKDEDEVVRCCSCCCCCSSSFNIVP
jgi:acyl-CoA reductase-like NAD-dependent aldehyde dehydrogenase